MQSYKTIIDDLLTNVVSNLRGLGDMDYTIGVNHKHIIERMEERDIDISDLVNTLKPFIDEHLPEFTAMICEDLVTRPFRVFVRGDVAIVQLSRRNENEWKLNTVLATKRHNLHQSNHSSYERTILV